MRYLLDTDHLSVLQRQAGKDYSNLSARMDQYPVSDFAVSTVTFHEQVLGCQPTAERLSVLSSRLSAASDWERYAAKGKCQISH